MARRVEPELIGIDVSKSELSVAVHGERGTLTIPNRAADIEAWLKALAPVAEIALEATGIYHWKVLEAAHRRGLTCYMLDGYRLNHYRGESAHARRPIAAMRT